MLSNKIHQRIENEEKGDKERVTLYFSRSVYDRFVRKIPKKRNNSGKLVPAYAPSKIIEMMMKEYIDSSKK